MRDWSSDVCSSDLFGREVFDAFLRGYFDHFTFQSITTVQFIDYAKKNLLDKHPGKVSEAELDEWVYGTGIPASAPKVLARKFGVVDSARLAWLGSGELPPAVIPREWSTQELVHFIDSIHDTPAPQQPAQTHPAHPPP